jgi:hypothetical protein
VGRADPASNRLGFEVRQGDRSTLPLGSHQHRDRWKCGRIGVRMDREAVMKGLTRTTRVLLLVAGGVSLVLTLSAFVVQVPSRNGSHNLVRTTSGGYAEVPVAHQTYFQEYGVVELALLGLGLVLVLAVGAALRVNVARGAKGAGRLAWGLSVASLILGVVGFVAIAPYLLVVGILLVLACGTVGRSGGAGEPGTSPGVSIGTAGSLRGG